MLIFIRNLYLRITEENLVYTVEQIKKLVKATVGSGSNLSKRLLYYFSPKLIELELKRGKSIIYNSILKYGLQNFKLEILEYCEKVNAILISKEQYFIDRLKPEYNRFFL